MQITVGQKAHREAKVKREMVRFYAEITPLTAEDELVVAGSKGGVAPIFPREKFR